MSARLDQSYVPAFKLFQVRGRRVAPFVTGVEKRHNTGSLRGEELYCGPEESPAIGQVVL